MSDNQAEIIREYSRLFQIFAQKFDGAGVNTRLEAFSDHELKAAIPRNSGLIVLLLIRRTIQENVYIIKRIIRKEHWNVI